MTISNTELEKIISRIISDTGEEISSDIDLLRSKIGASTPSGQLELLKLLREKNPPILGTGTVS